MVKSEQRRSQIVSFWVGSPAESKGSESESMGMEKRLVRLIAGVLAVCLAACTALGPGPSQSLVKQAIGLELSQTQQVLSQQLRLAEPGKLQITQVAITEQTPLVIQDLPSYRVRGTYSYTLKLDDRAISRQNNPFEVYLQHQKEGKTWRSARLQPGEEGEPVWVTQRVQ